MLPAKPHDSAGRPVQWVLLCSSPGFVYDGTWVAVDDAFLSAQLSDFERMTASGYAPPVLREHVRAGERAGDVLQLAVADVAGAPSLVAAVALADMAAPDKVASGAIKYVSPSFGPLEDDRGHRYTFALREVSLTVAPHQKHIGNGTTHILASEGRTMDNRQNNAEELEAAQSLEAAEELEAAEDLETAEEQADIAAGEEYDLGKMQALLMQIEARLNALEAAEELETAEELEAASAAPACELTERIAALELERDAAQWCHVNPRQLAWSADLSELLFAVWRHDRQRVQGIIDAAALQVEATEAPAIAPAAAVNPYAVRMSEPAPLVDNAPHDDAGMSAQAMQLADGDQRKALEIYKQLKLQRLQQ